MTRKRPKGASKNLTKKASKAKQDSNTDNDRPTKRTRNNQSPVGPALGLAESERMGRHVFSAEKFLEAIAYGRGSAVCVCANVSRLNPVKETNGVEELILPVTICNENGQEDGGYVFLTFCGLLASKVHTFLHTTLKNTIQDSPAGIPFFFSGTGATLVEKKDARSGCEVVFVQRAIVCQMLLASANAKVVQWMSETGDPQIFRSRDVLRSVRELESRAANMDDTAGLGNMQTVATAPAQSATSAVATSSNHRAAIPAPTRVREMAPEEIIDPFDVEMLTQYDQPPRTAAESSASLSGPVGLQRAADLQPGASNIGNAWPTTGAAFPAPAPLAPQVKMDQQVAPGPSRAAPPAANLTKSTAAKTPQPIVVAGPSRLAASFKFGAQGATNNAKSTMVEVSQQGRMVLGGIAYFTLGTLRRKVGQKTNVMGVVVKRPSEVRAMGGDGDMTWTAHIIDGSNQDHPEPGHPGKRLPDGDDVGIQIFRAEKNQLPPGVTVGDVILVKNVHIDVNKVSHDKSVQLKNYKVSKNGAINTWCLLRIQGDGTTKITTATDWPGGKLSDSERQRAHDLALWGKEQLAEGDSSIESRRGRMFSTLSGIRENLFFDCIVQIVDFDIGNTSVFVTDYTFNSQLKSDLDERLNRSLKFNSTEPINRKGGHVLEIHLFGTQGSMIRHQIAARGNILFIRNVRAKAGPEVSILEGALGNGIEERLDFDVLESEQEREDPEVQSLIKRRHAYIEQLRSSGSVSVPSTKASNSAAPSDSPSISFADQLRARNEYGNDTSILSEGSSLITPAQRPPLRELAVQDSAETKLVQVEIKPLARFVCSPKQVSIVSRVDTLKAVREGPTDRQYRVKARIDRLTPPRVADWIGMTCMVCEGSKKTLRAPACPQCQNSDPARFAYRWHFGLLLQSPTDAPGDEGLPLTFATAADADKLLYDFDPELCRRDVSAINAAIDRLRPLCGRSIDDATREGGAQNPVVDMLVRKTMVPNKAKALYSLGTCRLEISTSEECKK